MVHGLNPNIAWSASGQPQKWLTAIESICRSYRYSNSASTISRSIKLSDMDSEFSSNRFSTPVEGFQAPIRHPDLCFDDGNLVVVTGSHYFVVHRGLLCRHSEVLEKRLATVQQEEPRLLEGHLVLALDDDPNDFAHFLRALYG